MFSLRSNTLELVLKWLITDSENDPCVVRSRSNSYMSDPDAPLVAEMLNVDRRLSIFFLCKGVIICWLTKALNRAEFRESFSEWRLFALRRTSSACKIHFNFPISDR